MIYIGLVYPTISKKMENYAMNVFAINSQQYLIYKFAHVEYRNINDMKMNYYL